MSDDELHGATELRCFCRNHPVLAIYGTDDRGKVVLDVRVRKQSRIYGWIRVYSGEVKIYCRECYRWHRTIVIGRILKLVELQDDLSEPV